MRKHPVAVAIAFVVLAFVFLDLVNAPVEGQSGADERRRPCRARRAARTSSAPTTSRTGRSRCRRCPATKRGRGARGSTSSPRARTASSSCSAASCRSIKRPQAADSAPADRAEHRVPDVPPAAARCDDGQPSGSAVRTRRQDAWRRSRCRQAGRRLSLGAHRHRVGRAGQPDRGLDAVGQDVPAAARGLHQPVRCREERLDRGRLPPRDLQVLATTARSCCRRSASRTCLAPTTSTSIVRRSWRGCPTAPSSSLTATRTRAS